jgi:hypothetical protein
MSQINIFKDAYNTDPIETMSIDTFLDGVKLGRWKDQVERVRSCVDKDSRDEAKRSVPSVTVSGTFSKRTQADMITHSGFICIDVDVQFDRSTLCRDPYTYALFDSVSKQGVAIIVRINPDKHSESFDYLKRHYFETYGLVIDTKPRNVVSLRFVSYDPYLYINPDARVSKSTTPKPKPIKSIPVVYTGDQISQLVRDAVDRGVNIAESYEDYLNLSFALADEMGETGRNHFHSLASQSSKYRQEQADHQYSIALKRDSSGRRVTIGTFYHMLKQAGIVLPKSDNTAITLAATAKKSGADTNTIAELIVTETGVSQASAQRLAQSVAERPDITLGTIASDPEHLIESLMIFLKTKYPLKRNLLTYKIEKSRSGDPIQEEQINDIYLHARAAFNTPNVTKDLIQSIIFSSHTPSYHPIKEFIDRNRSITGEGSIDRLISCVRTNTPHASIWIRKWLIGVQAAIDGHPVRSMLVFTGPQYNGKTEFFRRLLPSELKGYYAESKLDRGKDDELLMCQKLIVMDDEMGGKSKQDEKRLKELTSKETFSLRAPYRKDNMDYKRLAILCGTSNPTEIITDPTGNTRILPVKVDSIDFDAINSIDRTELFMEAYHAYNNGESWLLTRDEVSQLNSVSDDFSSISYEKELILQFFSAYNGEGHCDWLTATEIKNEIEINTKQQIRNMGRFGIELRKLMGDPKSRKKGNNVAKCYPVIKTGSNQGLTTDFSQPAKDQNFPF